MGLTVSWITADSTRENAGPPTSAMSPTHRSARSVSTSCRDQLVTDVDDLVSLNPTWPSSARADSVLVDGGPRTAGPGRHHHRKTPSWRSSDWWGVDPGEGTTPPTPTAATCTSPRPVPRRSSALGGIDLYRRNVGTTLTEVNVALHAHVLFATRRALHRARRCRATDQRLSRPYRGAATLAGRTAGRHRGQGGHRNHRDRGARHHHGAGADQPLPHGMRHDRYGPGGRRAVAPVLQTRRLDPAEHPTVRTDEPDRVYITAAAKNDAIIDTSSETHATGQPILVGTQDVANPRICTNGCCAGCAGGGAQRQER